MAGEEFSSQRMLQDYTKNYYVRAMESGQRMREDNYRLTRETTAWVNRVGSNWSKTEIRNVTVPELESTLLVGEKFPITIEVFLGEVSPDDVEVQIISGRLNSHEQIQDFKPAAAVASNSEDKPKESGVYAFSGEVTCNESGRFGVTARIIPKNANLPHPFKPKLISWW
jgi:starch phosphorylase